MQLNHRISIHAFFGILFALQGYGSRCFYWDVEKGFFYKTETPNP